MVNGAYGSSRIQVGASLAGLKNAIDAHGTVIVTDSTVDRLYGSQFPHGPVIAIGEGETIKTLETVATIFSRLVDLEADRSTFILGIGGGIVCDITGFVASTYLRGVRFGFVSTTLLAQVDASVGGKNGVNFGGFKNMVGVFNQPEFVICDPAVLKSLPEREIRCGFAEIIKHGAIADAALLTFLENRREAALGLDAAAIAHLVYRSVEIKAAVVARDEREHGQRRKLNFGHTFGHAIEKLTGIPHGEAVGIGMVLAVKLSVARGLLCAGDADRLERIVQAYGLPTRSPVTRTAMLAALRKDKKREGDRIHFVFLDGPGSACVAAVAFDELDRLAESAGIA